MLILSPSLMPQRSCFHALAFAFSGVYFANCLALYPLFNSHMCWYCCFVCWSTLCFLKKHEYCFPEPCIVVVEPCLVLLHQWSLLSPWLRTASPKLALHYFIDNLFSLHGSQLFHRALLVVNDCWMLHWALLLAEGRARRKWLLGALGFGFNIEGRVLKRWVLGGNGNSYSLTNLRVLTCSHVRFNIQKNWQISFLINTYKIRHDKKDNSNLMINYFIFEFHSNTNIYPIEIEFVSPSHLPLFIENQKDTCSSLNLFISRFLCFIFIYLIIYYLFSFFILLFYFIPFCHYFFNSHSFDSIESNIFSPCAKNTK